MSVIDIVVALMINILTVIDVQTVNALLKSKFSDRIVQAIKPLPKFEHTRNLVKTYCLRLGSKDINN